MNGLGELFSRRLCLRFFNSGIVEGRVSRWQEIRALCFPSLSFFLFEESKNVCILTSIKEDKNQTE